MSDDKGTEPKRAVDAEATVESAARPAAPRTVSLRLSTVLTTVALVALVALSATLGGLWLSARGTLHDRDAAQAADRHAQQVATDYAVGASTINYQDVNSWLTKLKANTSPQLSTKFDATGPKLQQILVPLQWTSSATPIASTVMSKDNGVYKVDVFLNVTSTSAQTPDGAQTTVTYTVNVDPNSGWKVTDVGGMTGALPKQ
jgi:Mce-associated membrane protein